MRFSISSGDFGSLRVDVTSRLKRTQSNQFIIL
ncbi:unnamed protein product [Schistosoma mattheei]|uniref:Uncharacterized protein n=1 Tax=Schistosoma mattheei TaxID=31246 RepID=A0A183NL57_9TREM|nr:unnamed protein product [Schistosoma mattheei]